jgi:hypothetical protein
MPIEQAVFTSVKAQRNSGYHLAARSAGVTDEDARELTTWCPSHDAMLSDDPEATSINFHRLPSGCYCVSRTCLAGSEYSGRGWQVYSQCFLVRPDVLRRFANHPILFFQAAVAGGHVRVLRNMPESLPSFELAGRGAAIDQRSLERVLMDLGARRLAAIVGSALGADAMGIMHSLHGVSLFSALLSCIPVARRADHTFSTGLRFSTQRPFRWISLSTDPADVRHVERLSGLLVVDLSSGTASFARRNSSYTDDLERVLTDKDWGRLELLVDPDRTCLHRGTRPAPRLVAT